MQFLVADDHSIVRMGLRLMLEDRYPLVRIDEAENGDSIVEKIKQHDYDLLVLDFQMPNTDTFNIISWVLARHADFKILIYSMASEKLYAGKLLKAGVRGFLSKEASNAELLKAVEVVLAHGIYASDTAKNSISNDSVETATVANPFTDLSEKELSVLN